MGEKVKGFKLKMFLILCCLWFSILWCTNSESADKAVELEPIVVTATRTEKEITSAPGSVSVVTREDMDRRNIKSIDEALNNIHGVYYNSTGKGLLATTSSVSLRGLASDKRTLFMVDGMTINNAYTGNVGYQLLPVEDVAA